MIVIREKMNMEISKELDTDRIIAGYIKSCANGNYDDVIAYDKRPEIVDELASYRSSTISWYDIKPTDKILEIGGGFGAITGTLLKKAYSVTSLEFSEFKSKAISNRCSDMGQLRTGKLTISDSYKVSADCDVDDDYNLVIINDFQDMFGYQTVMERDCVRAILKYAGEHIINEGRVLIIMSNRLNPDMIPEYNNADIDVNSIMFNSWSRQSVIDLLNSTGFTYNKIYYPLPNYKCVCDIYTDDALPTGYRWAYLKNYNLDNHISNVDALEIKNCEIRIDSGAFPHFANSYIIEASMIDNLSSISSFSNDMEYIIHNHPVSVIGSNMSNLDQDNELINKVRDIECDILRELKRVCDANGIEIILIYGTLLGAIRHGGIIPGDDDIDVAMSREDYDKLLSLQNEFDDKYFLQTPWNDNCFYGGYSKLRNKSTSCIHPQNWWVDCCEGIGIDIFPIDSVDNNPIKEYIKNHKIRFYQRLLYAKAYGYFDRHLDMNMLKWKAFKYMGMPFSRHNLADKLHKLFISSNNADKRNEKVIYAHYNKNCRPVTYKSKSFDKLIDITFENMTFKAPAIWRDVLEVRYGQNYLLPVSWDENKWRHGYYSVDVPYNIQKPHFRDITRMNPGERKVVIFGDNIVLDSYMKQYGDRYKPTLFVEMPGIWSAVGQDRIDSGDITNYDIERISWDEYMVSENVDSIYPVIASIDMHNTELELINKGINNYYFYIIDRSWLHIANPTSLYNLYYNEK